jgi:5-methylcytosine-specific restriction endonuclease McrA
MAPKRKSRKSKKGYTAKKLKVPVETYGTRDRRLIRLGYRCYHEYLSSKVWSAIRARVFAEKGIQCKGCGRRATSIHHMSYRTDVLRGSNIIPLFPVCEDCHVLIEFTSAGVKRNFMQACRRAQVVLRVKGFV